MIRGLAVVAAIGLAPAIARADVPPAGSAAAVPANAGSAEDASGSTAGSAAPAVSPAPATAFDAHLARARELHDKSDFAGARVEVLAAYALVPRPDLLFALGQLEFNLHHYQVAIGYYERFEATRPGADQAALAEQAIGAARAELSRPLPAPPEPPPPPHREWDGVDLGLIAFGGLAVAASGGLLYEALHISKHDDDGTISNFDDQLQIARHVRLVAGISAGAGVVAIGIGLLRWRFHLVDTTIEVHASPTGAAISLEHAL